ncbi:MAG TPA: cysteine dioxygenase family protein [Candidatus Baltobacteraceae bacterium]|nr:cysteine dioxygenase family protein [Candidatus Baltobacteraceae bacterium]
MTVVEPFVSSIARAAAEGSPHVLTAELTRLCVSGAFDDAAQFPKPCADHYARRLLWQDPASGIMIIGFTWSAGQATPLHDHAGFWGAEVVVSGAMEETVYELKERGDGRYRFRRGATRTAGRGAIGVIEPPKEYHIFGNPGSDVARKLHVYGGDLVRCQFFNPDAGEWWLAQTVDLVYDD